MTYLPNGVERVLVPQEEIDAIVTRIAEQVDRDYAGKRLVLLCILKGSVVFMGDLMKKLRTPAEIDFMKVSSYGSGTTSSGTVKIVLDVLRKDLSECDFLIVEDIVDSGKTLKYLVGYLQLKGARSVKTCTLLDKPERRVKPIKPDFGGFQIPDEFVVGYGLDYNEQYRQLPYVGVVKRCVYEKNE